MNYYLPEKDKPSFYIFIFNRPKPPSTPCPNQILKAHSWKDAQIFAACFSAHTNFQYVKISALSPKIDENISYETNYSEYWNEGGKVVYTEYRMPAPVVKEHSDLTKCPRLEEWV